MATYSRRLLSASTNGKPIAVSATATPGTALHVAVTGTSGYDEVYLWASNVTTSPATLTLEWGGTSDPGDLSVKSVSIPQNSPPLPVMTGQVIQNGLTVAAFSDTASAINVTGYVNRIL